MKSWTDQDAASRFDELLRTCLWEGPQLITSGSVGIAVLAPAAQWQRITRAAKPTLKSLLLTDTARTDFLIPPRKRKNHRNARLD